MLLSLTLLLALGLVYWIHSTRNFVMVEFVTVDALSAHLELVRKANIARAVIQCVVGLSAPAALGIAYRQSRRLPVWIPLSLFGNVGAVFWLFTNKHKCADRLDNKR